MNFTYRAVSERHGSVSVLGGIMKQLIYIAEDEKNIRETLRSFLENDGYEVCAFETGDALLGAFFKRRSDLVILDIMMPVMNGYEAAKMIRSLDREDAKVIPIIAMTANAFTEDRLRAKEAGMDEHIAKPVDGRLLVKVINELVKHNQREQL